MKERILAQGKKSHVSLDDLFARISEGPSRRSTSSSRQTRRGRSRR